MIDWIEIAASVLVGVCLGLVYFGGLWWTITRAQNANRPVMFYLASLLVRTTIALVSLAFILQIGVLSVIAALAGMIAVRMVLVRRIGLAGHASVKSNLETRAG